MKKCIALLLSLLLLTGCGETQAKKETATVYAMDTVMTLTAYAPDNYPSSTTGSVLEAAEEEIRRLDKLLSVTDPKSEIYQFNHGDPEALSESRGLALRALYYAAITDGAYDPTVYPLMELWGFYGETPQVPDGEALEKARALTGYLNCEVAGDTFTLPEGFGLDLGGIAKGYTADRILEISMSRCRAMVISLGGNVAFFGEKPDGSDWNILIEDPNKDGEYLGTLHFPSGSSAHVVTSGGYERYFEENGVRYHHILDPKTGCPAETDLLSVTIIGSDGAMADVLSTALFTMGRDAAIEFWRSSTWDFDMVLYDGEDLYVTPGLDLDTERAVKEVTS